MELVVSANIICDWKLGAIHIRQGETGTLPENRIHRTMFK